MRLFDYFYTHTIQPIIDALLEAEVLQNCANYLLTVALFLTLPVWIIPYMLWRMKGGGGEA